MQIKCIMEMIYLSIEIGKISTIYKPYAQKADRFFCYILFFINIPWEKKKTQRYLFFLLI